jgi:hypothetical protein
MWLGKGRYRLASIREAFPPTDFDPVEFEVESGERRRIMVQKRFRTMQGKVVMRVLDPDGRVSERRYRLAMIPEDQALGAAATYFVGEGERALKTGKYTIELCLGDAKSPPLAIEVVGGEEVTVEYRRSASDPPELTGSVISKR